jgi:hypothetical protein
VKKSAFASEPRRGAAHVAGDARATSAWPAAIARARVQRPGGRLDGGSD